MDNTTDEIIIRDPNDYIFNETLNFTQMDNTTNARLTFMQIAGIILLIVLCVTVLKNN